ncbi:MAG: glycosyltransferase family 39 protein [Vicinamibacteria bacterium]|nr:glycosyltransferase family 39 protein [Vicinamibacteria bacterium]
MTNLPHLPRVALALLLAAYVLPLAVPVPLMEDDEGLHAAIALEMVERGDWTVPRLMGEPFLDKPILYFWMQAASLAALGPSEFAVRLPGTLMAVLAVAAIGWFACAMFGGTVGAWAAFGYATMLLPYAVSLAPLHDVAMVPLVTTAVAAFWHARHASSGGALAGWTLVAGVALGLSMLGKGLTGVGLVGIGTAAWVLWSRALSWKLVVAGTVALAIGAVIAWPWYAAMERAAPGYLHYFFMERHLEGMTEATQRHAGRPFWYYLPILAVGAWPWLLFAARRVRQPLGDGERLLWCWFVANLVVLSLAGSKLATYLLPTLPAVATLAAVRLTRSLVTGEDARWREAVSKVSAGVTATLPLLAMLALVLGKWPPLPAWAILWASVPLVVFGLTLRARGRITSGPAQLALVTAATMVVAALVVRPLVADRLTARNLAEYLNRSATLPSKVWVIDEGIGSLVFYLRQDLRRTLTTRQIEHVSRFSLKDVEGPPDALVAVASDRIPGVARAIGLGPVTIPPEGTFLVVPIATLDLGAARSGT